MKHKILLFLTFFFTFKSQAQQIEGKWIKVGETKDKMVYYLNSIPFKTEEEIEQFWVKFITNKPEKINGKYTTHSVHLIAYNKSEKTSKTISAYYYNNNGNQVYEKNHNYEDYQPIVPGTVNEGLFEVILNLNKYLSKTEDILIENIDSKIYFADSLYNEKLINESYEKYQKIDTFISNCINFINNSEDIKNKAFFQNQFKQKQQYVIKQINLIEDYKNFISLAQQQNNSSNAIIYYRKAYEINQQDFISKKINLLENEIVETNFKNKIDEASELLKVDTASAILKYKEAYNIKNDEKIILKIEKIEKQIAINNLRKNLIFQKLKFEIFLSTIKEKDSIILIQILNKHKKIKDPYLIYRNYLNNELIFTDFLNNYFFKNLHLNEIEDKAINKYLEMYENEHFKILRLQNKLFSLNDNELKTLSKRIKKESNLVDIENDIFYKKNNY